jgi:hypothetical protein
LEKHLYEKKDGMIKTNSKGKYDENMNVNNVMDKNNAVRKQLYEKPEKREMEDDIINAVILKTEYEAGIMVH